MTFLRCFPGVVTAAIMIALLAMSSPARSHHSHASLNMEDVRTYTGVVSRYSWTMPHVFLKVRGPDADGKVVEYSIEMNHPPSMAKKGWSRNSFEPGDRIVWRGPHDHNPRRHYTGLQWAERGDGQRFDMDDKPDGEVVPSTDFTGLWRRSDIGGFNPHYRPPEGWPLNERGRAMVDAFHEDNNPMVRCGNPGPPKAMIVPYPVNITRVDDDHFEFERELMAEKRVIHMDHDHEPGDRSRLGFSRGRFEEGALIVETTHFAADAWGSHTGIDSSAEKHLVERFELIEGGMYLLAEITITDPVYLSEPVTFLHRWVKQADREVIQAPCTMEAARLYLEAGFGERPE
ncbi:MAG: DUF6152 family protein [Pseudomonadota bacterium]